MTEIVAATQLAQSIFADWPCRQMRGLLSSNADSSKQTRYWTANCPPRVKYSATLRAGELRFVGSSTRCWWPGRVAVLTPQRGPKVAKLFVDLRGLRDRARHFFAQHRSKAATKTVDDRL